MWMAALIGGMVLPSQAEPPAKIALQGGRIIPVAGPDIESGTVLIENGRITAVGPDVEVPYDAMVVDVSGKVLFPGYVSPHFFQGLDRSNESLPVTPYLDVYDAMDPSSRNFEEALRDGVLTIHLIQGNSCAIGAMSRLVHPIGRTPDEMTIRPGLALKLSTSPYSQLDRMSLMATLRETFLELDDYLANLAESRYEAQLQEEQKELKVGPDQARELGRPLIRDQDCDDRHRNLFQLTQGRLAAWIYCGMATDVSPALALARERGFFDQTVLVLGPEAFRAVSELKRAKRPVILPENLLYQQRDPITGDLQETFIPKVIHEAGLLFALQPDVGGSLGERNLGYQAARCVRHGIPRQTALEAITLNPARMLGVADQLGSLEVGKAAYVLVLSGDPLEFNSWVEQAYIRGVLAYDRQQDPRLKELLGLPAKQAAAVPPKSESAPEPAEDQAKEQAEEPAKEPAEEPKEPAKEPAKEPVPEPSDEPAKEPVHDPVVDPSGSGMTRSVAPRWNPLTAARGGEAV